MNTVARPNLSTWAEIVSLCAAELVPQTQHHFLTIRIFVVCPKWILCCHEFHSLCWCKLHCVLLVFNVSSKAVMWTRKSFLERTKVISLAVNFPARLHHVLCLEHWLIWPGKAILNHFRWHKLVAAQLQNTVFIWALKRFETWIHHGL